MDIRTSESDGRFLLCVGPDTVSFDCDDLGGGSGETFTVFQTEEARAYYVALLRERELLGAARTDLEWLKNELRSSVTKTGRLRSARLKRLIGLL